MPGGDGIQVIYRSIAHGSTSICRSRWLHVRTLKHTHAELVLLLQQPLQVVNRCTNEVRVLAIDSDDGSAGCILAERWNKRRGDFGEKLDLVQEGDCHDGCFDAGLYG